MIVGLCSGGEFGSEDKFVGGVGSGGDTGAEFDGVESSEVDLIGHGATGEGFGLWEEGLDCRDDTGVGVAREGGQALGSNLDFRGESFFEESDDFCVGFDGNGADIETGAGFARDLIAGFGTGHGSWLDGGLTKCDVRGEGDVLEFYKISREGENGICFATWVGVSGVAGLTFCDEI